MAESGFNFSKLIEDSKATLTAPKEYFASMPKEGGFGEPVIKALIYGLAAGIFSLIWSLLNITAANPLTSIVGGDATGIMAFISAVIFALIGLFIGGVILLIISAICGGNTSYEANVRITASLMVLSPIQSFFNFSSGISIYLGMIIALLISLYGIYLMYNALISSLQAKEGSAKVVSGIFALLIIVMMIGSMTCLKTAQKYGGEVSDKYMQEHDRIMREIPKSEDLQKNLEKMREHLQKLQEENK